MLTALALTAQLLAQSDDSSANVRRLPPSEEAAPVVAPAPAAVPERGASLSAGPTTRRKSTNLLIVGGGIALGALSAYLALAGGIAFNFSKGGLSDPIDSTDALLLMVLPAATGAAFSWLVGLIDYSQRGFFGSALWAVLGAGVGELLGLGAGYLIGRAMFPGDVGLRGIVMIALAPAFAVLGSVIFMELFKPGEEVEGAYASLAVARERSGGLVFGPAFGFRF